MSIVLLTPSNGSVTLAEQDTASNVTVTIPARTTSVMLDGPAFRASRATSNQVITTAVDTKVLLNAESFDTANCFDLATSRFTPNVAGYYQFVASVYAEVTGSLAYNYIQIRKNGATDSAAVYGAYLGTSNIGTAAGLIYLNGSTDYVELFVQINGTGTVSILQGSAFTYLSAAFVRGA